MNNLERAEDCMNAAGDLQLLLARLAELNIKVWVEKEQLHINAPIGALNTELKEALRRHKDQLINNLQRINRSDIKVEWPELRHDLAGRNLPFPLSDVQHAYWLGRSKGIEFGNVATHFYYELDCVGLDLPLFSETFNTLIQRHDMMRAIVGDDGQQVVLVDVPCYEINTIDVSGHAAGQQQEQIEAVRAAMSHQLLPADRWPLFDIRAVRLSGNQIHLFFSWDFINLDAWSIYALCREWNALYLDSNHSLPPVGIVYRDYVLSERTLRDSALYKRDREYWWNRIDSLPEAPVLPIRAIPTSEKRQVFTRRRFRLGNDAWSRLQNRAKTLGITPSSIMLAAFSEVLAYWSKQPHFTLNLTFFNRLPLHPDVYKLVGDFTSLILLEIDLRKRNSFKDRAEAIQKQFLQDFEHRLVSGVEVMREWSKRRGYGLQAVMPVVFTSCLVLNSEAGDDAGLLESFGKMVYGISQTPQVFLDNQIMEDSQGLVLNWDAVEEVFEPGVLDAMFNCYSCFITALSESDIPWNSVHPLQLPEDQLKQRQLINRIGSDISHQRLHEGFLASAARSPDAIALRTSTLSMSYGELLARACTLAENLNRRGVTNGSIVAVVIEKGWEQVVATLGILIAGGAYLPIDPDLPNARRQQLFDQSECQFALVKTGSVGRFDLGGGIDCIAIDVLRPANWTFEIPDIRQRPDELAYVIFTSGSTGVPKGVMIDHRGAVNTLIHVNRLFEVTEHDSVLAVSSLSFDLSVYDIFGVLGAGGCVVIPDAHLSNDPDHWISLITSYGVTLWNSAPALMMMLLGEIEGLNRGTLETIRLVMLSGDWIPLNIKNKLEIHLPKSQLISLGGATEASVWSIYYPVAKVAPHWNSIPYGKPLPNQAMHVLNEHLQPCPTNVIGQIYIGGVGLALGYMNDQKKTEAHFIIHPQSGEKLYYTGDLGRFLPDGNIEFLGREDSQVKLRGHRIELGEIETLLNQLPGIDRAVVSVIGQHENNRHLAAYLVAGGGSNGSAHFFRHQHAHQGVSQAIWHASLERGELNQRELLKKYQQPLTAYGRFWDLLEQMCVDTMYATMQRLSDGKDFSVVDIVTGHKVKPEYEMLIRQWLAVLTEQGYLLREADQYQFSGKLNDPKVAENFIASIEELPTDTRALVDYFQECLASQYALLTGAIAPIELLFPDGGNNWSRAESLYQTNPVSRLHNKVIAEVLAGLISEWPQDRPIRLLEVGAGTGGATGELLAVLPTSKVEYCYTDVTGFFFPEARRKFAAYEFLQYEVFDINREPTVQGFERHTFDFVIAINVLHDAGDLNQVLGNLRNLLDAGGRLLALEATRNTPIQMVTVGYLEGFGNYKDERLHSNLPLLSVTEWREFLKRAGYSRVACVPDKGNAVEAMVQHVVVAEAPELIEVFEPRVVREFLATQLPEYMVPQYYGLLDKLPVTSNGKIDYKQLTSTIGPHAICTGEIVQPDNATESDLLAIWREILASDDLSVTSNFFDVGGDSLLLVQMRGKIQAKFGLALSTTLLFEHPTIRALAAHIGGGNTPANGLVESLDRGNKQRAALMRRKVRQNEENVCVDE